MGQSITQIVLLIYESFIWFSDKILGIQWDVSNESLETSPTQKHLEFLNLFLYLII